MTLKNIRALILACGLAFISQGCAVFVLGAATAAGAGTFAYIKGTMEKTVDKPVTRVHKATLAALKDLKMFVKVDEVTPHKCRVKAETADKKAVTIEMESLTELSTKIGIRVGIFGNRMISQMVLTAIQRNL